MGNISYSYAYKYYLPQRVQGYFFFCILKNTKKKQLAIAPYFFLKMTIPKKKQPKRVFYFLGLRTAKTHPRHTQKYLEYLASAAWKRKRYQLFLQRGKKCERCGAVKKIEVHHKHYRTLGHEALTDLEVVCVTCHRVADAERKRKRK